MDLRNLSLMMFPQQWSGTEIIVNLLLLPAGDPTASVAGELPFSQAQPVLRAVFLPGFGKPCWDPTVSPASLVYAPLFHPTPPSAEQPGLAQPPFKAGIFAGLAQQFTPSVPARTASLGTVMKDLPPSYLAAAGSPVQPPSGEDYGCDLRNTPPDTTPVQARTMAWGEVFSHSLRQPLIAQAIGLSYLDVHIPLSPALMSGGGWLWVEIDTTNAANWYAALVTSSANLPGSERPVRSYAARIPPLTSPQDLFAAVLFPTQSSAAQPGSMVLDQAQYEADLYVAGVTQVVHAYQPTSADAIVGDDQRLVPGTDAGFQLGWDDEQVRTWQQRQVQTAQAMASGAAADEFPLGVQGYRVDARQVADGNADPASPTPAWHSLVTVQASVSAGDTFSATATEELTVEPVPVSNGGSANFWLPRYFAHWRGRSLVVNDPYAYAFSQGQPPVDYPQNPAAPQFSGTLTEIGDIGLRYGDWYQFRTRLADLTGGGPAAADALPGAGVATVRFLRNVPPKAPAVTQDQSGTPAAITVARPRLNYPEMVFAGAVTDTDLADLLAQLQGGQVTSVFVPDPDVATLEVIVEAQAPSHDTGHPGSLRDMSVPPRAGDLDGNYRVVYRQQIPFTGDSIVLSIDPQPAGQIRLMSPPAAGSTTLPVPTGRNLRIRMRGLGTGDDAYWGSTVASTGLVTDLLVRYEVEAESGVLLPGHVAEQLQAFYLREDPAAPASVVTAASALAALAGADLAPGLQATLSAGFQAASPTPLERLALALALPVTGQTLTAPAGRRVLFGAQNTLRHSVTQDRSAITFSSEVDLIGHWIVVIRVTLDRDWTYSGIAQDGPGQTGFVFSGAASTTQPNPAPAEVGRVNLPGVVSLVSVQPGQPTADPAQRDQTDLIFFATVDSTVPPGQFPAVTNTGWALAATFTGDPAASVNLWSGDVSLPITSPPQHMPRLVSAGIAESPYVADSQYTTTEPRQRALWLEFDRPPPDTNDEYFYRILGYGPDPLLVSEPSDRPAHTEPPLNLDPEWIRMIAAGDSNDDAGVGAMTQLTAATGPAGPSLYYLLPPPDSLPPSALELFGCWTIEIRDGHTLWSTAQARYGRALRVSGVQFPPPPLTVSVDREVAPAVPGIVAVANLAQTVDAGVSLTTVRYPQTAIWFLLYAQVQRVDGQAWRNILLARTPGTLDRHLAAQSRQLPVRGRFAQSAVQTWLSRWQLPASTPTSVLAVELFNAEADVVPEYLADAAGPPVGAAAVQADPLGSELGARRILRVSPLTPVRPVC
jgi:hypothetical protein